MGPRKVGPQFCAFCSFSRHIFLSFFPLLVWSNQVGQMWANTIGQMRSQPNSVRPMRSNKGGEIRYAVATERSWMDEVCFGWIHNQHCLKRVLRLFLDERPPGGLPVTFQQFPPLPHCCGETNPSFALLVSGWKECTMCRWILGFFVRRYLKNR